MLRFVTCYELNDPTVNCLQPEEIVEYITDLSAGLQVLEKRVIASNSTMPLQYSLTVAEVSNGIQRRISVSTN